MLLKPERCLLLVLVLVCSGLSLGTSSTLGNKTNLTCFRSSDPAALGATQLFGSFNDKPLWSRDQNSTAPLPPCSSSTFSPPPSRCEVCHLEKVVYMICDNLPDGESLDLEDPSKPFYPKKSDCPTLPPAGSTTAAPVTMATVTTGSSTARIGLVACLGVIIIIIIIIVIWFARKCCKPQQTADNEPNNVSYKPVNGSVQIDMNGNGHVGPPAE